MPVCCFVHHTLPQVPPHYSGIVSRYYLDKCHIAGRRMRGNKQEVPAHVIEARRAANGFDQRGDGFCLRQRCAGVDQRRCSPTR